MTGLLGGGALLAKVGRMVYVGGMEHDPVRAEVPKLAPDATDEEFDAWMEALRPCPGIGFADDDIENDVVAALADLEAGRCVPHEIVSKWLQTWGTPDHRGFWEWYAAQDG